LRVFVKEVVKSSALKKRSQPLVQIALREIGPIVNRFGNDLSKTSDYRDGYRIYRCREGHRVNGVARTRGRGPVEAGQTDVPT